ncbi:pyridoxamine 5'-phosphate oxidase family protein [Cryobacterium ruanii]|uniref:pyridoxamine 5'-phosphate oxidase family protein n=1 Tax=Cryobacterium ruanii TaxID=1259197 RepID=UPI0018E08400
MTHLDGLVYARSLFDSSMRYRAAVIHGVATALPDAEKEAALVMLAEHLMPGRAGEVRPILQRELAATMVLRVPLTTASVKDNSSSLIEEPGDGEDRSVWAGLLPLRIVAGEPEPSAETANAPVDYSVLATRNHLNQL